MKLKSYLIRQIYAIYTGNAVSVYMADFKMVFLGLIIEDGKYIYSVISKSNEEFEYNIYNTLENDPAIEPVINNVDYDVDQTLMTDFDI